MAFCGSSLETCQEFYPTHLLMHKMKFIRNFENRVINLIAQGTWKTFNSNLYSIIYNYREYKFLNILLSFFLTSLGFLWVADCVYEISELKLLFSTRKNLGAKLRQCSFHMTVQKTTTVNQLCFNVIDMYNNQCLKLLC